MQLTVYFATDILLFPAPSWLFLTLSQDFFEQLDHRVLSVFLKSCDELTDILPQEEQRGLQDTIHMLHKQWKVSG